LNSPDIRLAQIPKKRQGGGNNAYPQKIPGGTTLKVLITTALAGSLALTFAATAMAQPPAAPAGGRPAPTPPTPATGEVTAIPANLKPPRLRSSAIVVADLPAQQKWYETVFGFVKVRDVSANEIVESLEPSNPNATNLTLQKGNRQPGATTYGRLIINVDNAKDIAAFLQTHGVTTRQVIPNQAYFLNDPEGNQIEIYQFIPPAK
jgi:catechol 2,3-dioxygenase-like lactoylglutathione lyase family enzyme